MDVYVAAVKSGVISVHRSRESAERAAVAWLRPTVPDEVEWKRSGSQAELNYRSASTGRWTRPGVTVTRASVQD